MNRKHWMIRFCEKRPVTFFFGVIFVGFPAVVVAGTGALMFVTWLFTLLLRYG